DDIQRCRLRPRVLRRRRPRGQQGAVERRRVRVGRRSQHRVLGRPDGGDHGAVPHSAASVEHLSHPHAAQAARLPGPRRLMAFKGWPAEALEFFEGLEADNSKTYWQANKQVYEDKVKGPMEALLADLKPKFGDGKIFRPYRDVRFSAN